MERILAVALLALLLVTSCSAPPDNAELFITVQNWTGWSEKQPQPTTTHVRLRKGATATVPAVGGEITITVTRVTKKKVTITTSRAMAPRTAGTGIDLSSKQTRFSFAMDERLSLTTPTMDGGTTVTLSVQGMA